MQAKFYYGKKEKRIDRTMLGYSIITQKILKEFCKKGRKNIKTAHKFERNLHHKVIFYAATNMP